MPAPRKIKAIVSDLVRYKDNVTLYRLKTEIQVRFRPGQFLHLSLDHYDPSYNWPESRVFSIASSPDRKYQIDILVSPKGFFTNRMISEITLGTIVWLKLPFGDFNYADALNRNVILIAGGTGISPFISYLELLLDGRRTYNELYLYYGVKDKELLIYEDLINNCSKRLDNFHYKLFVENGSISNFNNIKRGILPVTNVIQETKLLSNPIYYLSGPQNMILAFKDTIKIIIGPDATVVYDKWE